MRVKRFRHEFVKCNQVDVQKPLPYRIRNTEMEHVQAKIGYRFVRPESLRLALTAAHRSDLDGSMYDGNRGLAKLGLCAVDMTETYRTIIVEKGTSSKFRHPSLPVLCLILTEDANTQIHWFKNKGKRASVCTTLGVDHFVIQSVRQHHQAPSTEVLATVLSAILGAIWLDLQTQNGNFPIIVEQTFDILRRMEAVIPLESIDTPWNPLSANDECGSPISHNIQKTQEGSHVEGYTMTEFNGILNQDTNDLWDNVEQSQGAAIFNESLGAKYTTLQS
jgi:dsRNA-specific ribonuclease